MKVEKTSFAAYAVSLCGSALATMAAAAAPAPAAPTTPSTDAEPTYVDEIVVTAQKRSESVQRIPIAVTALQGDNLEQRNATWWYGEQWSIVDAYINWVWFRVTGTTFDASGYRNFARHDAELAARPSVLRALARNQEAAAALAAQGLAVTFSGTGAYAPPKQ